MRITFVLDADSFGPAGLNTIFAPPIPGYAGYTPQQIGLNINRSLAETADPNDPNDYVLDETLDILLP